MNHLHRRRGFSLIEVIIVVGIMAIVAAIALPSFFGGHNQADLNGTTSQIAASLRTAQSQSVSQVKGASWGIHFANGVPVAFGAYISQIGTLGTSTAGQLSDNYAIAVDPSGNIYTDDVNNRISKFDANGNFVKMWGWGVQDGANSFETCTSGCQTGISGSGAGQLNGADYAIAYYSGKIYVAEKQNNRVEVFDATSGSYLSQFGTSGLGTLNSPYGLAIDASGNVYVGDQQNYRIVEFNSSGTFVKTFGWGVQDGASSFEICTSGCQASGVYNSSGLGAIDIPYSIAIGPSGDIYVAQGGGYISEGVTKFDSGGNVIGEIIPDGVATSSIDQPLGMAIDSNENLYISNGGYYNIKEFDSNGNFLGETFPSSADYGSGPGQFYQTAGVAFDPSGNLYVTQGTSWVGSIQKIIANSSNNSSTSAINNAYYAVFTGSSYASGTVQNVYPLPATVAYVTSSVPLGSSLDVIFSQISGSTTAAKVGIYSILSPSLVSWISVGSSGQVSVSTSSTP